MHHRRTLTESDQCDVGDPLDEQLFHHHQRRHGWPVLGLPHCIRRLPVRLRQHSRALVNGQ